MTGRVERLEKELNVKVHWRAFPLHPDTPTEGLSLEALFQKKGMQVDVEKMVAQLKKTATDLGLEFGDRKKTFNSRLAQEVGLWAETKNRGDQFHMAAFKAYFVDGRNIAEKSVLQDLIRESGLELDEGRQVIKTRSFSDAVDSDWDLSRQSGITAVPTFIYGFNRLVGAQPYEALKRMVSM